VELRGVRRERRRPRIDIGDAIDARPEVQVMCRMRRPGGSTDDAARATSEVGK
jgi:hypothetical protein